MLKIGWIVGITMLFVIQQVICGVCELTAPLSATAVGRIEIFMNPSLNNVTGWLGNLWSMFWFDYPFFEGTWALVKYIFFYPVSIGIVVILAITIAQLVATVFSGVTSALRGIRP